MDERSLRALIADAGGERLKLEFKRKLPEPNPAVKLAREVAAIANTDGGRADGVIILGAKPTGEMTGGVDFLGDDQQRASMLREVLSYIDPEPRAEWLAFRDDTVGWFGALWIHPSAAHERPHFIARTFDAAEPRIRRGDVLVRRGESVDQATRAEVERLFRDRYGLELDRLRGLVPGEPLIRSVELEGSLDVLAPRKQEEWMPFCVFRGPRPSTKREGRGSPTPRQYWDGATRVRVRVRVGGENPVQAPWRWRLRVPADLGQVLPSRPPAERSRSAGSLDPLHLAIAPPRVSDGLMVAQAIAATGARRDGPEAREVQNDLVGWCNYTVLHNSTVAFDDLAYILAWSDAPERGTLTWEVEAANLRTPLRGETVVSVLTAPAQR